MTHSNENETNSLTSGTAGSKATSATASVKTIASPSQNATIDYLDLSPDFPKVNAFGHFIGFAIIFVVLLTVNLAVEEIELHFMVLPLVALAALVSTIYGFCFAKSCQYFRGEFELMYKQGLWWKKQTALSFSRIQHIDISHGPLERKYSMATIKFFTAGGVASDLRIPGLPSAQAERLRAEILQYAKNEFETESNHG